MCVCVTLEDVTVVIKGCKPFDFPFVVPLCVSSVASDRRGEILLENDRWKAPQKPAATFI